MRLRWGCGRFNNGSTAEQRKQQRPKRSNTGRSGETSQWVGTGIVTVAEGPRTRAGL